MSRDAGPPDGEIWRILAMGRHAFGDSSVIGITRGALEKLANVVEFARLARGFATFGFDHDRRGRFRVFPIRRADYHKLPGGNIYSGLNNPPIQNIPRRSR